MTAVVSAPDRPGDRAEVILEARDVSLGYGSDVVVRHLDLDIRPGEFWFVLGPNGSGKTTFVRTILDLMPPLSGTIVRSAVLQGREHVGFVPQRCELNPALQTTVREFVSLGLVGMCLSKNERRRRLDWSLERVGLPKHARTDYWSLSGGQRQRAVVARALVRQPALLILDEPTNGLDLATEEALMSLLSELNVAEHRTAIFVTHDLAVAARHATHVALFYGGRVLAGPRESVLNDATLREIYGVDPGTRIPPSSLPQGGHH